MTSFAWNDGESETSKLLESDKIFTNKWSTDCNPTTGSIVNKQGLRLATFYYPAKGQSKGTIFAIHGYGAHTHWQYMSYPYNMYKNSWVELFNESGYDVLSYDCQSHGLSEGIIPELRCHINRFDDLIDDALQIYYEYKKTVKSSTKIYVLGVSMGGNIAAHVAVRLGEELDGLVLGAPMLSVEKLKNQCKNRILLPISSCMSVLLPTLAIVSKAENKRYPEIAKNQREDPLNYHGLIRVRFATENMETCDSIMATSHNIVAPTYICHSLTDTFTDPEGSIKLYGNISSSVKELDHMEEYDMWHGICKEPNSLKVAHNIVVFLDKL